MNENEAFVALREAVIRFMAEDHLDWRDIHEGEMARLCGVEPDDVAFTWKWAEALPAVGPCDGL